MKRWESNNKLSLKENDLEQQVLMTYVQILSKKAGLTKSEETKLLKEIQQSDVNSEMSEIRETLEEEIGDSVHFMEIGNLLFGNARGQYPIERGEWENKFCELLEAASLDYHGIVTGKNKIFETDRGGYENGTFLINPYYWGDDEEICEEPNFVYKPTGYEIQWYKYPLRDSYANQKITYDEFSNMVDRCVESVYLAQNDDRKTVTVGDVVQTAHGDDRGLVIEVDENNLPIDVLSSPCLSIDGKRYEHGHYGGVRTVDWYSTGERMTKDEWFRLYSGEDGWERYCTDRRNQKNFAKGQK